jgi:hypothetical protein
MGFLLRKTQMLVDPFNSLLAVFAQLCLLIPGSCADARLYLAITAKISVHVLTPTHMPIDRYRVTVLHAIAVLSNPHSRN